MADARSGARGRLTGAGGLGPAGRLLVLVGLTGFAVSQPLLSALGANPTLFVFHGVTGGDLVWVVLAIAVAPPLVLWGLGLATSLADRRLGRRYDLGVAGLLVALAVIQVLREVGLTAPLLLTSVALAAGGGFAYAYGRVPAVSLWARYTALLPVAAVALFLFASPTGDLVRLPGVGTDEAGASETTERGVPPPVVVVMLDELPTRSLLDDRGDIDEVRFPNLAGFADDATWYRHYTTLAPYTDLAVPSILTGTDPVDRAPLWSEHPDNLFTLLEPTHELRAYESLTYLCATSSCAGDGGVSGSVGDPDRGELLRRTVEVWAERVSPFAPGPEVLDDFEEDIEQNPNALTDPDDLGGLEAIQNRPTRLAAFVDGLGSGTGPSLDYLHLVLPHHPWRFYEDGSLYEPVGVANVPQLYPFSYENDYGGWASALSEQRHLLQAQYTDRLLGEVFDELRATGRYDESLVVVTADHGASLLGDTPVREATDANLGSVAYVPLLVKAPGQTTPVVDDSNLLAVDLVPTIADLLGVDVPWSVDGAAAGSAEVTERGSAKYFHDFRNGEDGRSDHGVVVFDDTESFPDAADRWIPPAEPGTAPLAGLYGMLDVGFVLGLPMDDLVTRRGGRAEVVALGELRDLDEGAVPPGIVSGRIVDGPVGGTVLVAIDGTVVAASPVYDVEGQDGYFAALLGSGTRVGAGDVRLAVASSGEVVELDLTEP